VSSGGASSTGGSVGSGGVGPTGGTGGVRPTGGTGGSILDCTTQYTPAGGPRPDGPPVLGSCASLSDAEILARYDDFAAKVPQGLYWEPSMIAFWEDPCSPSLAQTVTRSSSAGLGTFDAQFETAWFYEAAYCQNGLRRVYRNLRCDYFDGTTIRLPPEVSRVPMPQDLAFLASLLWWRDNGNIGGNALLGYSIAIGNATDWVEMCTLRTTYGDFGLCDEITLESTTHTLRFGGTVELGTPSVIRTIQGRCR
jgi:hypothetical protein